MPAPTNETSDPPSAEPADEPSPRKGSGFRQMLFGKPRDINDPSLFHSISLIPFLAWVGLGVDGLSSCAYGPDESFRALFDVPHWGSHPELAVLLAIATTVTVAVISWSYSGLIEHFPYSGGGYGVASKLLGPYFGLISGCALLVDYVLTVTTSIASSVDQGFNMFPPTPEYQHWKIGVELVMTGALVVLNLRGMKESITIIVPIFLLFCATHLAVMIGVFVVHPGTIAGHVAAIHQEVQTDANNLGLWVLLVIFLQAYSRGAGTYTGIEAVSNGVSAMRVPQVTNAKWTMLYMAVSLAVTAGGLMICYLLADLHPVAGRTMNGLLVAKLNFGSWVQFPDARIGGGTAPVRGADGLHRRPARDGEHGAGWLGAAALQLAVGPVDEPLRSADGGRGGGGKPALHERLGRRAGDDVRDQRVRDFFTVATGHDAIQLDAAQAQEPGDRAHSAAFVFVHSLHRHSYRGGDFEILGGRVGDDFRDQPAHRALRPHSSPLRAGAREAGRTQRAARRHADAGRPRKRR